MKAGQQLPIVLTMRSGSDEGGEAAALHLVRALAAISNVRIAPRDSVNELLCSIVAKHILNFTRFPEDDCSGGAPHPNSRISSKSSRLKKFHVLIGPKFQLIPILTNLWAMQGAMVLFLVVTINKLCKQFTVGMLLFMQNKEWKIKIGVQFLGSRQLVHTQIHALCMFKFSTCIPSMSYLEILSWNC